MTTDIDAAAERVRRVNDGEPMDDVYLTQDPMQYEALQRDRELLADAYLAQDPPYTTQATKLAEAQRERDEAKEVAAVVLSSLKWTGDGYDWTGGQYDYRLQPHDAVAYTVNELRSLREKVKQLTAAQSRLAEAQREIERLKAEFDSSKWSDDDVPDYASPAYEVFNRGIDFAQEQLRRVLGVKEWWTSGGGSETLDGDLRSELNDLLKAAGRDDDSLTAAQSRLAEFDDETPVDEAWLRSVGFIDDPDRVWLQLVMPLGIEVTWWRSDGGISLSNSTNGLELGRVTCKAVRHLLAALNIDTKGQ